MAVAGTLVAESRSKKKAGKKKRQAQHIIGPDGKKRRLLTVAKSVSDERAYCPQCGLGYGHKREPAVCDECRIENAADRAKLLEEQGINLGWGNHEVSHEYVREQWHIKNKNATQRNSCTVNHGKSR